MWKNWLMVKQCMGSPSMLVKRSSLSTENKGESHIILTWQKHGEGTGFGWEGTWGTHGDPPPHSCLVSSIFAATGRGSKCERTVCSFGNAVSDAEKNGRAMPGHCVVTVRLLSVRAAAQASGVRRALRAAPRTVEVTPRSAATGEHLWNLGGWL
jgi:hypothetical protein